MILVEFLFMLCATTAAGEYIMLFHAVNSGDFLRTSFHCFSDRTKARKFMTMKTFHQSGYLPTNKVMEDLIVQVSKQSQSSRLVPITQLVGL